MSRSQAVRWAKVLGVLALSARAARGDEGSRIVLGSERIPEAAVEMALVSCRGESLACLEGWLDGFRLSLAGRQEGLESGPRFSRVKRDLLLARLYGSLGASLPEPSEGELRASYERDKAEFVRPEAIRIFRILFDREEAGRTTLEGLPAVVTLAHWRAQCRALSVDRATHERGGDLGFVGPDGGTDVPEVRADPVLHRAAARLKDGEVLRELVPEGDKFALIWRRGSRAAQAETFEQARTDLALRFEEARRYELLRTLLSELRGRELHEFSPQKLAIYADTHKSR